MPDNVPLPPSAGNAAADEVPYSGDTAKVQLVRIVGVTGAEGAKSVNDIPNDATYGLDVDVTRVPAPLSTAGGGTEATALRVTIATDSTGVLSVDDNGSSLTVDAPVGAPVFVRLSDGASAISTLPVSLASVPSHAVTNAGTFAVQVDGNALTALQLLDDVVVADNAAFTDGTTKLSMGGYIYDEVAGTALTENDAAAARINVNRAQVHAIEDGATRGRYVTVTASNALKVDGSAVTQPVSDGGGSLTVDGTVGVSGSVAVTGTFWQATQPVSAASLPLPTGAATESTLSTLNGKVPAQGQALMAASVPVAIASNQSAIPITDNSGSLTVDDGGGSITVDGTVAVSGSVAVTGTFWQATQPVSLASVPSHAVTNAGTFAVQVDGAALTALQLLDDVVVADNAAFTDGTTRLSMSGYVYDEVAGTALTENDAAAARINANRAVVQAIEDGATRGRYATVTASNALKVDGSGVTQPVSGTFWQATQPVSIAAAVAVTDNSSSLTVDAPVAAPVFVRLSDGASAISTLPVSLASLPSLAAGTANIGDVDVLTVPAPLNVTGGGLESTALRVTIASDSTGVLSVDDNGGSLTVDGTVAVSSISSALPAGTNAIGKLAANSGVDIGDVDVTSIIPGTGATNLGKAEDAAHASGDVGVMALGVMDFSGGGAAGDYTPFNTTSEGIVRVQSRSDLIEISVQSSGLTTSVTNYAVGDQMGAQFTLANAARNSGGGGYITGVTLIDVNNCIGAVDVVFFNASVTLASDNAAFSVSDADGLKVVGVAQLSSGITLGGQMVSQASGLAIPYTCSGGTSLYAALITRYANTFFTAATDLQLKVWVDRA